MHEKVIRQGITPRETNYPVGRIHSSLKWHSSSLTHGVPVIWSLSNPPRLDVGNGKYDEVDYSTLLETSCPHLDARMSALLLLFVDYLPLLFNKLSLCPYMVRNPSISVILHDRYPAIYVNDHIWKCTADFLSLLVWRPF